MTRRSFFSLLVGAPLASQGALSSDWMLQWESAGRPSFTGGTDGRYMDFGAGTLAMLHGPEMITPLGAVDVSAQESVSAMTVVLESGPTEQQVESWTNAAWTGAARRGRAWQAGCGRFGLDW